MATKQVFNPLTGNFDLVTKEEDPGIITYIFGNENTDGSWRNRVDTLDSNALVTEKRVAGVWEEVRRSNF